MTQRPATPGERVRWSVSSNNQQDRGQDVSRPNTSSRPRLPSVSSEVSEHPSNIPARRTRRPAPLVAPAQGRPNAPATPPRRSGWDLLEGVDLTGEDPQDFSVRGANL